MSARVFLPGAIQKSISERPSCRDDNVNEIIEGVERYNPSNSTVLEEYLGKQCSENTYDGLANLALLKLYQFNPQLVKDEAVTNSLIKALCYYPRSDFSLCLHLLPAHLLQTQTIESDHPDAGLAESVQKINHLFELLNNSKYAAFWRDFEADEMYAELVNDCIGFHTTIRLRISQHINQTMNCVESEILQQWLNIDGDVFKEWVHEAGWSLDGSEVRIPMNRQNEAVARVTTERMNITDLTRVVLHSVASK